MERKKFTKQEELNIINLHKQGNSPTKIATLFNTYNTSIRRVLLRNNIKLKNNSESKVSIKENPFINYETDEKAAYWLGYLIADGSISSGKGGYRVIINTNKDPEHLQKYAEWIGKSIHKYWNKTYNVWEYSVVFYNKAIVEWFISIGVTPKKSLTLELKIKMNSHILRGVFDGDGYLNKWSANITSGSFLFITSLEQYYIKNELSPSIVVDKRGNRCYTICAKNLVNWNTLIYKNATIFLERKFGAVR